MGALRTLTMDDGRIIVDRLEEIGERSYSYSIVESPLPFQWYRAKMEVTATTQVTCQLTWSSEFEPKGISDEKAIKYITGIYHWGIGLMVETLEKQGS